MQDTLQNSSVVNHSLKPISEREVDYTSDWVDTLMIHQSIFQPPQKRFDGEPMSSNTNSWVIAVLLIGFSFLAISRSVYRKRFTMLHKTLGNWKLSKQIIRYEKVYTHPVNILMTLNFILMLPLFFSLIYTKLFNLEASVEKQYLFFTVPLAVYLIVKTGCYQFSGWLWDEKAVVEEYLFQSNLFNKYAGVVFLILTSLVVYAPLDISIIGKAGVAILILILIFQLIRGVVIGLENGKHLFFIIAYLCTLEILPWLVIAKWIKISL